MIRLQHALAVSPDQVTPLPPPVGRVRELEEENVHLHREIESLRRQLEAKNARLRPDIAVRSVDTTLEARPYDPEYRGRHAFNGKGDLHTVRCCTTPTHTCLFALTSPVARRCRIRSSRVPRPYQCPH